MAHVGKWKTSIEREEDPNYNHYSVDILEHGRDNPVANVKAKIYTPTVALIDARLERLQPDETKDVPDSEFLKMAEIAVNEMAGLPMYVVFPGAATQP